MGNMVGNSQGERGRGRREAQGRGAKEEMGKNKVWLQQAAGVGFKRYMVDNVLS